MMSKKEIEAEANEWIRSQGWSEESFRAMSITRWCRLMSPDIMLAGTQRQTI